MYLYALINNVMYEDLSGFVNIVNTILSILPV